MIMKTRRIWRKSGDLIKVPLIILGMFYVYLLLTDSKICQDKLQYSKGQLDNQTHDTNIRVKDEPAPAESAPLFPRIPDLDPPYTLDKLLAIRPLEPALRKHNVTRVIVNAYYRSGSTLLGRMFKLHPSAFYIYEPFRYTFMLYKGERNISRSTDLLTDEKTHHYKHMETDLQQKVIVEAGYYLSCRLEKIRPITLYDSFPWLQGCRAAFINSARKSNLTRKQIPRYDPCVMHLRNQCYTSDIRVFKTIRLPMGIIQDLIDVTPGLKVIYNTRDPRTIYFSRKALEKYDDQIIEIKILELCSHIIHDLQLYNLNQEIYKNYIYKTSYDDMIQNPEMLVSNLYRFIKAPVARQQIERIVKKAMTSGGRRYMKGKNKKKKVDLSAEEETLLKNKCAYALNQLGYGSKSVGF